jgi:hypothetical protein
LCFTRAALALVPQFTRLFYEFISATHSVRGYEKDNSLTAKKRTNQNQTYSELKEEEFYNGTGIRQYVHRVRFSTTSHRRRTAMFSILMRDEEGC